MDDKKCLLCGLAVDEGRQVCPLCEKDLSAYREHLWAAFNRVPVEYDGNKYGCISAFIIRFRASSRVPIRRRCIYQVELMSGKAQSVIIADPKEVKVLKEWRPEIE